MPPTKFSDRYDLHCHSLHSDGEKSVKELLSLAKEVGLRGISITDHDTINAYDENIISKEISLEVVTGVEISCLYEGKSVHILGYSFSHRDPGFQAFIAKCKRMRYERNMAMLSQFKAHDMDFSIEEVEGRFHKKMEDIGRPHFAKLLIEKGYAKNFSDAFNKFLADDKKCFVLGERPSISEAIDAIQKAKGFAILAHPHIIKDQGLVKALLKLDFDGIEGYYAKMAPNREQRWLAIAKNKGWMVTGGSDFHGECKPINKLGSSWVLPETFNVLKKRQDENDRLFESSSKAL